MKRDVAVLFGSRAIASVAQAVAVLLLARLTAPPLYGTVSSLLGIGLFLTAVLDFGLGAFLLRVRASEALQPLLAPAHLLNYIGSALLLLAVTVTGILLLPDPVAAILLSAWVAGDKYVDTALAIPIADGRVLAVGAILVIRRTLAIAGFFALIAAGLSPILAFALAQLAGLLVGLIYIQRSVAPRGTFKHYRNLPLLFHEGRWFWLANLSGQVAYLDNPIIAAVSSAATAGFYAVGGRLTRPFILFASALSLVLVPASTRSRPGFGRFVARRLLLAAVVMCVVGVALGPLVPLVIRLTAGAAYLDGAPAAAVLLISMPFFALTSPLGGLLQGQGAGRYVAMNGLAFGVVTLVAIGIGAWGFGAVGAAIGLGIGELLKFTSLLVRAWRT